MDKVYDEITKVDDDLNKFITRINKVHPIDYENPALIQAYDAILKHVQLSGLYSEKAYRIWSKSDEADPWLIAYAKVHNCVIVTFEEPNSNLGKQKAAEPKIPDVCKAFEVKCVNLFGMLRDLHRTIS